MVVRKRNGKNKNDGSKVEYTTLKGPVKIERGKNSFTELSISKGEFKDGPVTFFKIADGYFATFDSEDKKVKKGDDIYTGKGITRRIESEEEQDNILEVLEAGIKMVSEHCGIETDDEDEVRH